METASDISLPALTFRELRSGEIDRLLRFRNLMFGPLTREQWDAMGCTAVVATAGPEEEFWGAIPLQYRRMRVNGKVSIPVVFENAVGVMEKARDRGIGTRMLQEAARFLHDRVDAMFVYRGGERSAAYRFYRKTNHGDLYYVDHLQLDHPVGAENSVVSLPADRAIGMEATLLAVWRKMYGNVGGCWDRQPGYFRQTLTSHVYRGEDWRLFLARRKTCVAGYAITNPSGKIWKGYCLYDIAASDHRTCRHLLDAIAFQARALHLPVTVPSSVEHPLNRLFIDYGFRWQGNSPFILAHILRPDRIFTRLAGRSPLRKTLKFTIVTPHREVVVNDPAKPRHEVFLYCKESHLSRLMTCRLNLRAALQVNQVRLAPSVLKTDVIRELCRIFSPSRWVTFGLDYI